MLDDRRCRPCDGAGAVTCQRQRQRNHLDGGVGRGAGGALGEVILRRSLISGTNYFFYFSLHARGFW